MKVVTTMERVIDDRSCDPLAESDGDWPVADTAGPGSGEPLYGEPSASGSTMVDNPESPPGQVPIVCTVEDCLHFAPAEMLPMPYHDCEAAGHREYSHHSHWPKFARDRYAEMESVLPRGPLRVGNAEWRQSVTSPSGARWTDQEAFRRDAALRCLLEFLESPGERRDKVRAAVAYADELVFALERGVPK